VASRTAERLAACPLSYLKVANNAETAEPGFGQRVIVTGYNITASEEQAVKLTDGTNTLEINTAKSGNACYTGGAACPAFEFKTAAKVKVEGSAAHGHLTYVIV